MASVVVAMTTPAGKTFTERSNVGGFANFQMSLSQRDASLRKPGEYLCSVRIPPGWILTTGNAEQRTTLEALPGAPADLVSRNPPRPFGLAPRLVIGGRVVVRGADGAVEPPEGASLSARGPGGETVDVLLSKGGFFESTGRTRPVEADRGEGRVQRRRRKRNRRTGRAGAGLHDRPRRPEDRAGGTTHHRRLRVDHRDPGHEGPIRRRRPRLVLHERDRRGDRRRRLYEQCDLGPLCRLRETPDIR